MQRWVRTETDTAVHSIVFNVCDSAVMGSMVGQGLGASLLCYPNQISTLLPAGKQQKVASCLSVTQLGDGNEDNRHQHHEVVCRLYMFV